MGEVNTNTYKNYLTDKKYNDFLVKSSEPFIVIDDFRQVINNFAVNSLIDKQSMFDNTDFCSSFGYDYTWFISRKSGRGLSKTAAASLYYSLVLYGHRKDILSGKALDQNCFKQSGINSLKRNINVGVVTREWIRKKLLSYRQKEVSAETNLNYSNLSAWSTVGGKRDPSNVGKALLYSYFTLKDYYSSKKSSPIKKPKDLPIEVNDTVKYKSGKKLMLVSNISGTTATCIWSKNGVMKHKQVELTRLVKSKNKVSL